MDMNHLHEQIRLMQRIDELRAEYAVRPSTTLRNRIARLERSAVL